MHLEISYIIKVMTHYDPNQNSFRTGFLNNPVALCYHTVKKHELFQLKIICYPADLKKHSSCHLN